MAIRIIAYLVMLVLSSAKLSEEDWISIPMPSTSYFIGFSPPTNKLKWQLAIENAKSGKQILLEKVIEQVQYPGEIISGDIHFGWIFRLCDSFVKSISDFAQIPDSESIGFRTPITLIGNSKFESSDYEGRAFDHQSLGPNQIVKAIKHDNFKLPKKMIAVGLMNENWGWLSTHYLNRTATWGFGLTDDLRYSHESSNEQIKPFLDDPNLVMILVNQHHNVTHPKVISLPRGVQKKSANIIWNEALRTLKTDSRKTTLMFSGSSKYRHRPNVTNCVKEKMGEYMQAHQAMHYTQNIGPEAFTQKLMSSIGVLAVPGLGYDCWRIWESLLAGSMPVLEKGTGLDRSLYKLPALLLDDFSDLTPELLRQAYVEALYRIDEWDYTRITERYWQRMIYEVSKTGSIENMLKLHPMKAEDATFTRPLIPFDCEKMGGCGVGTKRVPKKSCAVDPTVDIKKYDWNWYETWEHAVEAEKKARDLNAAKAQTSPEIKETEPAKNSKYFMDPLAMVGGTSIDTFSVKPGKRKKRMRGQGARKKQGEVFADAPDSE